MTSMGVVPGRFGTRNTPTIMYAAYAPPLHRDDSGEWVGGLFWDGRASSLEDQVAGPLLNPLEMNNPDKAAVVAHVRTAAYAQGFRDLYGPRALDDVDEAFAHVAEVLAAYERSDELSPFASRYDHYLAGTESLSAQELRGFAIFQDPLRGNCASCHPPPLFTTFGYANLGIPHYANNPGGAGHLDHGLADTVHEPAQDGKFRVPTLRDIARTKPYSHAGYFDNLPFIVDFLATRDVGSYDVPSCSRVPGTEARCAWPPPEIAANVDARIGHLPLSDQDLADLVAFLETLDDP